MKKIGKITIILDKVIKIFKSTGRFKATKFKTHATYPKKPINQILQIKYLLLE